MSTTIVIKKTAGTTVKQTASAITVTQSSGAMSISVSETPVPPTGFLNVLDHGAVGNGTTDDTAAIQATLNAATSGQTVWMPSGHTFLVSTSSGRSHNFAGVGAEFYACDVPDGVIVQVDGTLKLPYTDIGFPHSCIALMNHTSSSSFTVTGSGTFDGAGTAVTAENLHWAIYAAGSGGSLTVDNNLTFTGWRGKSVNVLGVSTGLANVTLGSFLSHNATHGNGVVVAGAQVVKITGTRILDSLIPGHAEAMILVSIGQITMQDVVSTGHGNLGFIGGTIGTSGTPSTFKNCQFVQPAAGGAAAGNLQGSAFVDTTFDSCFFDASATADQRGITVDGAGWTNVRVRNCTSFGGAAPSGGYKTRINPTDNGGNVVCGLVNNGGLFIKNVTYQVSC